MKAIGIDIGSLKTMMVAQDAEIVLTDTGSISRPTLVAFYEKSRLVGEEAAPQISGDSTLSLINLLIGKILEPDAKIAAHRRIKIEQFSVTSLLGLFVSKLWERILQVHGPDIRIVFSLAPNFDISVARAVTEACTIAGIELARVAFADASDCIVATYARKLQALRAAEIIHIEGKKTVLVEMGHTQSTVTVVDIGSLSDPAPGTGPKKIGFSHDPALGGLHFDMKLFDHFAATCASQHGCTVEPGTKKGQRLLSGCERLRKLLSQLGDAKVTVENLTDSGDVSFTLKRDEFAGLCRELLDRFKALIRSALESAGVSLESVASEVAAIEIVGGGVRMPSVQAAIAEVLGDSLPLGAKFDDASVALGAALVANKAVARAKAVEEVAIAKIAKLAAASTVGEGDAGANVEAMAVAAEGPETDELELPEVPPVLQAADVGQSGIGLSPEEVAAARIRELAMQALDAELTQVLAARNDMEAYILEMRSAKRRKHGEKIDGPALEKLLDDNETWMWDNNEANLAALREKVEQQLAAEALKAEAERAAEGDDEDHDNRRLKTADRMRMAVKNKDEGTELFKGGNFRPAAARYQKALTHCAKFFDLSPEEEKEVKALKTTLHLNLASCYIKLEVWAQVERNCDDAIALDPDNVKAYFRRSSVFEAKKDWEKALADIKKCQALSDVEDKMVNKASERIRKEMQKEKDKEKKMWGKAFA